MVWTLVEPGVAITAASLITIRPLLRALNFSGFGSTGNPSSRNITANTGQPHSSQRRDGGVHLEDWGTLSSANDFSGDVTPKEAAQTRVEAVSDAESEELILQGVEEGRIRWTRTVVVTIDAQGRGGGTLNV
jgi:hypothetical protein